MGSNQKPEFLIVANANWTQHLTGLCAAGNEAIIARQQKDYAATIKTLEGKLNTYLETGQSVRGIIDS